MNAIRTAQAWIHHRPPSTDHDSRSWIAPRPASPLEPADVRRAAARIAEHLTETPTQFSPRWRAWLKLENLQETGSYKVRGALNALTAQVERGDHRALMAASAGNHGAGVAWAAARLGLRATLVVPVDAPRCKIERIQSYGATVVEHGEHFEESLQWATQRAEETNSRLLHAFDDLDIIAGQGTVALELLRVNPDVVVVPIGGGGLASGVLTALRGQDVKVVGVQIEGVDAMRQLIQEGVARIEPASTLADGLRVREAGRLTREICRRGLSAFVTVTEAEVRHAMDELLRCEGLRVEGAGAVAVAGLRYVRSSRAVAIISGGNVDPVILDRLLDKRAG